MSYTNETTYYGLPLPTGSDKSTFTDNNTAFQAVDAALHTAYEQSGAATEDIVAIKATVSNLIQADIDFQNDLDTEKGKIRNLQDKEVLQDSAIAAVKADAQDMITAYNEPTATSTHAYSVGDFFIYNDVLYKATDTIAIGDTIVPDTNCATTNVTSELIQIDSDVDALKAVTLASVTADGTSSYSNLLNNLYSQLDISFSDFRKLTLSIATGGALLILEPSDYDGSKLRFSKSITNASACEIATCEVMTTGSHFYAYNTSTSEVNDLSSNQPANGSILSIVKVP